MSETARRFGDRVRSPGDVQRLSDFEDRIYLPLVLSAILPIVAAGSRAATDSWVSITVNIVAWAVFVLDLAVHVRLVRGYLRSGVGVFDLLVVIITAPWFLIPGFSGSQVLVLARLARLMRLVFVSKAARRLASQLGKVGLFAAGMLLFCSWTAYVAEHPTNPEFSTFWSSLWWGVVTLTTVGYGDIVPDTQKGRVAATFLMFTGIATLGLISGTLASAFRLSSAAAPAPPPRSPLHDGAVEPFVEPTADLTTELTALRAQLAALDRRIATLTDDGGPEGSRSTPER